MKLTHLSLSLFFLKIIEISCYAQTICSVGSLVRLSPKYNEAFENGINLSLNKTDKYYSFSYSMGAFNALSVYKKMKDKGCRIIIGFNNSDELTSISRTNPQEIIVSPYGYNFGPSNNIFSLIPNPEFYAKNLPYLLKKINHRRFTNFVIFYASNRVYTTTLAKRYLVALKKESKQILTIPFDEGLLSSHDKYLGAKLNEVNDNSLVFVLSGLVSSSKIIREISRKKHSNVEFIGTPNLGSKNYPAFGKMVGSNHFTVYVPRYMSTDFKSKKYLEFKDLYYDKFKHPPLLISSIARDSLFLGKIVGKGQKNVHLNLYSGMKFNDGKILFDKFHIIRIRKGKYELFSTK